MNGIPITILAIFLCGCSAAAPPSTPAPTSQPTAGSSTVEGDGQLQWAFVAAIDGVAVKEAPDRLAPDVTVHGVDTGEPYENPFILTMGLVVAIIGTAIDADGGRWAEVVAPELTGAVEEVVVGWISLDSDADEPILPLSAPEAPACPQIDDTGRVDSWPAANPFLVVECLGGSAVVLQGELAATTRPCEGVHWLTCSEVSVGHTPVFTPTLLPALPDGSTVVVIGHVDDGEATRCGQELDPAERIAAVVVCRSRLVANDLLAPGDVHEPRGEPAPTVTLGSVAPYADGTWIRYTLIVENASHYPVELFAPAPGLPPCGSIDPGARTWIDILSADGARLGRVCMPGDGSTLSALSFGVPAGAALPPSVFVELHDRQEDVTYRSNLVELEP